jgi:hypothetical protein
MDMKQFIILAAMIILGLAIFDMIAGPDEDSILSTVRTQWEQEIIRMQ